MKKILISVRPQWCEKIASGEKTIEVRKTAPKELPFKAYVYVTKDKPYLYGDMPIKEFYLDNGGYKGGECNGIKLCNGKVIGEFICDKVYNLVNAFGGIMFADENLNQLEPQLFRDMSCLTDEQTADYLGDKDGYGLHITDLKIYDKPKGLSEFRKSGFMTEEEWLFNLYPNTHCHYDAWAKKFEITRPPQSYMFVEEFGD